MHLVHHELWGLELGKIVLEITHIQVEGETSVQH